MPRVNIYIRNEDHQKWLAIADKPAFIHDALLTFAQGSKSLKIRTNIAQTLEGANKAKQVKGAQNNPTSKPYKFPPSAASML